MGRIDSERKLMCHSLTESNTLLDADALSLSLQVQD